jgi:ATP-dependent RNA helicase RhlE
MKQSFSALGVSAAVEQALAVRGIVEPFYIQSLVLPDALAGRDVLAKSPTGSGKTLAFGVPLVERVNVDGATPEALVLVPTRELALQVADEISSYSSAKRVKVALAYGGAPVGPQAKRLQGAHIVVATPGRLQDLIERRLVKLGGIRILVLDEADRMLDMGFRPQVERILRSVPRERQTMLFSATLDGEVGELAHTYTKDPSRFEALREIRNADGVIEHDFVPVTPDGKIDTLVELLEAEEGLSLVFVRTKRGADRLEVETPGGHVGGDEGGGATGAKVLERALALRLPHVAVHCDDVDTAA